MFKIIVCGGRWETSRRRTSNPEFYVVGLARFPEFCGKLGKLYHVRMVFGILVCKEDT